MQAERRLLLTGTPLQNNLLELMSLLCFVMPDIFQGKTEPLKKMFSMISVSQCSQSLVCSHSAHVLKSCVHGVH